MADWKRVYAAPTEEAARGELESFRDIWDCKYPKIINHGLKMGQHCPPISSIRKLLGG